MMNATQRTQSVSLAWLLRDIAPIAPQDDRPIRDLALRSSDVTPGSLFLALPGTRQHGLRHAAEAMERGATAIVFPRDDASAEPAARLQPVDCILVSAPHLVERVGLVAARFHGDPSQALTVVAVTGTDGKTSVSHLLAQCLDDPSAGCGLIGTLGAGRPHSLTAFGLTTPDALALQQKLSEFKQDGCQHVVMEASSHALAQCRIDGTHIQVAVLTNLGRDHLDYHGSVEDYAAAKARLFGWPDLNAVVLNLDDPFSEQIRNGLDERVSVVGYARTRSASGPVRLRARDVSVVGRELRVTLASPFAGQQLAAPLIGDFNVDNMLACAASLLALDWSLPAIRARLAQCRPIPGRMETVDVAVPARIVVDYAHTPQALEKSLQALRSLTQGELWCVFGCGGDRDPGKRALMGAVAERFADRIIVTDDNPRTEDPTHITAQILAGMKRPARVRTIQPRENAIAAAMREAVAGDLVLIAGKGHESYQVIGTDRRRFDDREVARQLAREIAG